MRFIMLVDVEGVTGVTNYKQAEFSEFGISMMMNDVRAVLDGILSVPGNEVLIFEEHTDGCNVKLDELPEEVNIVRGKPLVQGAWHGIDSSYDGLIMVGFHARAGVKGALLPHSYVHWNRNIWINDIPVGEIGMETALAGENGVPLVMVSGDSHGVKEALDLVPGVVTVSVKEALGEYQALCYPPAKTKKMLYQAGASIGKRPPKTKPFILDHPVTLRVELENGSYLNKMKELYPDVAKDAIAVIHKPTLTEAWTEYLRMERRIMLEL